jgi:deoxyribonuclease V
MLGWLVLIIAIDVHYVNDNAFAAGILFSDWESDEIEDTALKSIGEILPYESGYFYKRELPCILALLSNLETEIDTIIIDGFVTLGDLDKPGLGRYLYDHLDRRIPVVGVAKRSFYDTPARCQVLRGESKMPLYVTAAGISLEMAKNNITRMHGNFRMPTLLKKVDLLCGSGQVIH